MLLRCWIAWSVNVEIVRCPFNNGCVSTVVSQKMNAVLSGIGVAGTLIYLVSVVWLLGDKEFDTLNPNEIGDFLAGIFSPLAFLWLVLGYFQQGSELRASREALKLQAEELKNSVEQQKGLVEVSRKQLEAEFSARETEHKINSARSQPVLVIGRVNSLYGITDASQSFVLHNHGHSITDVRFVWSNKLNCSLEFVPVLKESGQVKFTIKWEPKEVLSAILELIYKDGLGEKQVARYLLTGKEHAGGAPYQLERVQGDIVSV